MSDLNKYLIKNLINPYLCSITRCRLPMLSYVSTLLFHFTWIKDNKKSIIILFLKWKVWKGHQSHKLCNAELKKVHKQFPASQSKGCPKVALRFPRAFQIGLPWKTYITWKNRSIKFCSTKMLPQGSSIYFISTFWDVFKPGH